VTVYLSDGGSLRSGRVGGGLSFPQPGWDEGVMEQKFRWLVDPVLGPRRAGRLVELVWGFERLSSVRELIDLVQGNGGDAAD
jgi:hypothetical protein